MACQERRMSDSEPSVLLVLLAVVRRDMVRQKRILDGIVWL